MNAALRSTFAVVAPLMIVATACTGDGGDTTPTTTSPPPVVTSTTSAPIEQVDRVAAYVLALADPLADAAGVATGDAVHYLDHRRLTAAALGTSAVALPGDTEHQLCVDDGCARLDGVVTDPATGQVVTFSIDGQPLAGRITGSGLIADDDGVVAQTLTAYVTNAGQLVVTVEVSNTTTTEVELFGFAAVLQPTDGSAGIETAGSFGETLVGAGSVSRFVLVFDRDRLGGRIGLRGLRGDGLDVALEVDVPTVG